LKTAAIHDLTQHNSVLNSSGEALYRGLPSHCNCTKRCHC